MQGEVTKSKQHELSNGLLDISGFIMRKSDLCPVTTKKKQLKKKKERKTILLLDNCGKRVITISFLNFLSSYIIPKTCSIVTYANKWSFVKLCWTNALWLDETKRKIFDKDIKWLWLATMHVLVEKHLLTIVQCGTGSAFPWSSFSS